MKRDCIAATLSAAVLLAAGPALAGKSDDTFNIGLSKAIQVLDPIQADGHHERVIAYNILEPLLYWDAQALEVKPGLATAWKYLDDKTIELTLREGVRFHNGEAFDADDVVYSVTQVTGEGLQKMPASLRARYNFIDRAEKVSPTVVRIHLNRIAPLALQHIATSLWMMPNEHHAKVGAAGFATAPVGTGPYAVADFESGRRLTLQRFAGYHGAVWGKPEIGKIVVHMIPEIQTQIAETIAGKINFLWRLPRDQADRLARAREVQVAYGETTGMDFLILDAMGRAGAGPMQDLRVRRAIAHAINRPSILQNLVGNGAQPMMAQCHPNQFGCPADVPQYAYDPAKAKALLAEAGHANGVEITLSGSGPENRAVLQAIQADLAAVGIKAALDFQETNTWIRNFTGGKTSFTFCIWTNYGILDADTAVSFLMVDDAGRYHPDDGVKQAFIEAGRILDREKRIALYKEAFTRIADQVYTLPLWTQTANYVMTPDVAFTPPKDGQPLLYTARWK